MEYDRATETLTIGGHQMHRHGVEAVLTDLMDGRAVVLTPATKQDRPGYHYLSRAATDADGRSIVARRFVRTERLLRRLDGLFRAWSRRTPPAEAGEQCTYPACACRPGPTGATQCRPPDTVARDMGLAPGDEIVPACGVCGRSIRVGAKDNQAGGSVYMAVCSEPDCGWRGVVVVTVQTLASEPTGNVLPPDDPAS